MNSRVVNQRREYRRKRLQESQAQIPKVIKKVQMIDPYNQSGVPFS